MCCRIHRESSSLHWFYNRFRKVCCGLYCNGGWTSCGGGAAMPRVTRASRATSAGASVGQHIPMEIGSLVDRVCCAVTCARLYYVVIYTCVRKMTLLGDVVSTRMKLCITDLSLKSLQLVVFDIAKTTSAKVRHAIVGVWQCTVWGWSGTVTSIRMTMY